MADRHRRVPSLGRRERLTPEEVEARRIEREARYERLHFRNTPAGRVEFCSGCGADCDGENDNCNGLVEAIDEDDEGGWSHYCAFHREPN